MNKWTVWYNNLPEHTKKYLERQAVWHDKDLITVGAVAFVLGIVIGGVL